MARVNNILTILLSICLAVSCSLEKRVSGEYCISNKLPNRTVLFFRNDNTYNGYSDSDIMGRFLTSGRWAMVHDTLKLVSDKIKLIDSIAITSFLDNMTKLVFVEKESEMPISGILVKNLNQAQVSNVLGQISFDSLNDENLSIHFNNLHDELNFKIVKNKSTTIYMDFSQTLSFKVSSSWIVRGNRIIPLESGYSIFKKCSD